MLADRGIRARIFNANASSLAGELPPDCATPQLWVDDGQAERARALIDEYLRAAVPRGTRLCGACGEENPASFDVCWACGQDLDRPPAS